MDSEAFNSFCITCDQLCAADAVYCSTACRDKDEQQLMSVLQPYTGDMMSPLLTPLLYQATQMPDADNIGLPLLLPAGIDHDDSDVREFSLNYSLSQPLLAKPITSTSQNYRLWLSGVL